MIGAVNRVVSNRSHETDRCQEVNAFELVLNPMNAASILMASNIKNRPRVIGTDRTKPPKRRYGLIELDLACYERWTPRRSPPRESKPVGADGSVREVIQRGRCDAGTVDLKVETTFCLGHLAASSFKSLLALGAFLNQREGGHWGLHSVLAPVAWPGTNCIRLHRTNV